MAAQMQQLRVEKEELLGRNTLLESLLKVATQVQVQCDLICQDLLFFE